MTRSTSIIGKQYSSLKKITILSCLAIWLLSGCRQNQNLSFDFEKDSPNAIAQGWSKHHFGEGVADWEIVDDHGNKVFAQLQSENPKPHFNIAVYDGLKATDTELSVKFKAMHGTLDQGGGFVWRYRDESNHYIVRANPLENNVVLYKMEKGVRTNLPLVGVDSTYGMTVSPMGTDWHTLGLKAEGALFIISLDGKELFQVKDSTFTGPGKIGLWTKADAVTYFDELHIRSTN